MKAWMEEAAAKKAAESEMAAEERERKRSITGATTAIESAPGPVPVPMPAQASAPAPQPSAPSKTLDPYGGYDPRSASAGAAAPAPAVSAPKSETKPSPAQLFPAEALVSLVQLKAPAKTWQPPVGYDPKSRTASAAAEVTAEEQERKRGITGATPAVESVPAPLPRPAQASAPAAQASAISKTLPEEKLRALAEKWGYDPKSKSASTASPAASVPRPPVTKPAPAPAPAPTLAQTQVSVQASAAPSKKWQPPGGYVPKGRRASTASPEPAAGMPTVESAPAPLPKPAQASAPAPQPSAPSKTLEPYGGYDPKTASASSASPAPAASASATGPKPTAASMPAPKPAPDPVSEPTSDWAGGAGKETQTNTGRFSSLVDFDHTGMNDKVHLVWALLARLPRVCRVGSLTVGRGTCRSSERRSRRRWAVSAQNRRAASE